MFASLGGLHVGHLRRIKPHGYVAGTLWIVLFNVVLDGLHLFIEHGMPLMIGRSYVHRLPRLALSASRTGWEAATKVFTCICDAVIDYLCAKGAW